MDSHTLAQYLRELEASGLGVFVRMTPNLYPILESFHVLGIALLLGPAIAVDLRLLGVARNMVPVTVATRYLLPVSHLGFLIVVVTGATMFAGVAVTTSASAAFPWKFSLIALAGLNIAVFHFGVYRSVARWDIDAATPMRAKIAGVVSALSWTGVVFAGRFLAY